VGLSSSLKEKGKECMTSDACRVTERTRSVESHAPRHPAVVVTDVRKDPRSELGPNPQGRHGILVSSSFQRNTNIKSCCLVNQLDSPIA
jgi:hypothetical protein